MKILTWNLERLTKNKNQLILAKLNEFDADILILTETSSKINLGESYSSISTKLLPENYDGIDYKNGENRVTIWTKYKIKAHHKTCDEFTNVCAEIETPLGLLTLYATIIGVFGGKGERFKNDLKNQINDFEKLLINKQVCIAGDFNVMFSGYAYPSHLARQTLNDVFDKLELTNTTKDIKDNVDHIVVSKNFLMGEPLTWNEDKKLSDHIGICISITE